MRVWIVCGLLAALMLAGCAEETGVPGEETQDVADPGDADPVDDVATKIEGRLFATVEDVNVTAGVPFNLTLAYEGNSTDAAALVWEVSFSNTTADDGNATADDSTVAYNGTGLPATIEVTLDMLGEVTMTGTATDGESTIDLEGLVLMVADAGVPEEVDPCKGVGPQEPISTSGLVGPGAVNEGWATDNPFTIGPCQTKVTIAVTTTTADIIIRLIFPDGSHIDYDSAFVGGDTFAYNHGGIMPEGEYNAQLRQYATVADEYEMNISFD